jgi:hypothetical protein
MAQATINNPEIFDRKNFLKEQYNSLLIKETPSFELRRKILASQNADGLSEQDLRNQVSELRMRKIFSAIPLFGVLGIGDWAQSPIPNPQSPIPMFINLKI